MARVRTDTRFPPEGGFYSLAVGCEITDLANANRSAAEAKVRATLTPPTIEQAEGWLVLLQAGTAHRSDSEAGSAAGLTLYAGALSEYPADVARAACAHWARTQKWFPTLSELIAVCERFAAPRRVMLEALTRQPVLDRYERAEPSPEERAKVRAMWRKFADDAEARQAPKPRRDFTPSQGKPDASGITPELRAIIERQRAA